MTSMSIHTAVLHYEQDDYRTASFQTVPIEIQTWLMNLQSVTSTCIVTLTVMTPVQHQNGCSIVE